MTCPHKPALKPMSNPFLIINYRIMNEAWLSVSCAIKPHLVHNSTSPPSWTYGVQTSSTELYTFNTHDDANLPLNYVNMCKWMLKLRLHARNMINCYLNFDWQIMLRSKDKSKQGEWWLYNIGSSACTCLSLSYSYWYHNLFNISYNRHALLLWSRMLY